MIMTIKLITYLGLLFMVNPIFANKNNSQNLGTTMVSFSVEKATILEIFTTFEEQTPFRFLYDSEVSTIRTKFSYKVEEISLRDALKILSKDAHLRFNQINRSISVKKVAVVVKEIIVPIFIEIKGKVTDENSSPLIGASVTVKETNVGTTTDYDGNFTLEIPDDAEILIVSYIGFKTEEVSINGNNNFVIVLQEDPQALDEVIVQGYRKSLEEGIDIKKNKINAVDVIVAEDIAKFPQSNLAEALQRISGIQIRRDNAGGVGNGISIRGLDTEYTQVTIDGDATPNNSDNRSYNFNTLPAEIFNKVEVIKTPTAKTVEGGIGGTVNLVSKKPFELKEKVFVIVAESVYNTQQQEGNSITPKFSLAYGKKWDRFGIIAGAFYNEFNNTSEGYDVTRYYTESYDLDGDKVNDFTDIRIPRPRYISQGQQLKRLSLNLSAQYQVSDKFDLVFEGLFINNNQVETRYTSIWFMPGDNPTDIIVEDFLVRRISYASVDEVLENQQQENLTKNHRFSLRGKWNIGKGYKMGTKIIYALNTKDSERFRYYAKNNVAVTYSVEKDLEFFDLQTPTNLSNPAEFRMSQSRRYLWNNEDEIITAKIDFSKKISNRFDIEFGSDYRDRTKTKQYFFRRDKSLDEPFYPIASLLTGFLDNIDKAKGPDKFLVHNFDKSFKLYGSQLDLTDFKQIDATFDINERINSIYAMGNLKHHRFDANFGVRIVATQLNSRGFELDDKTQIFEVREVKSDYTDILPSVNLNYEFARNLFARVGFARVITRPKIQDLSSYRLVDEVNKRITAKNPNLNPFRANQYDISLEWYPLSETLISSSFFMKNIESFISKQTTVILFDGENYELRQPINGNNATIRGLELNFQQPFAFLPSPFDGLGVVANYTFSESDFKEKLEDGSSVTYQLPSNSKHSYNLTAYYEKYGFSLRIARNFRSSFLREIPNIEDGLKYRDDVGITDISSSYNINNTIGITLNVLNAFNSKKYEYIFEELYMDNVSFFGTTFQLGVRAKF